MIKQKEELWVVGVSGGADSMSLLDMCVKEKRKVIVAHVNYQKRDTANRDMRCVQEYCSNQDIPCFVLCKDTYEAKENFQSQARKIRYEFYEKLVKEYNAKGVLIAHHMDDVIETYEIQKQRNSESDYYGIKEEVEIYNIHVKRLLLGYTKEELIRYCENNKVQYYDDESNFSLDYTRNKIRHTYINKLSKKEKIEIIKEIENKNKAKEKVNIIVQELLEKNKEVIEKEMYLQLEESIALLYLRKWIIKYSGKHQISNDEIKEIQRKFTHNSHHFVHNIDYAKQIVGEYDRMSIHEIEEATYRYEFTSLEEFTCPQFKLVKEGELINRFSVDEEDFPITIRNYQANDKIKLRIGTKRVSRFFIDRKISKKNRETWPVVVNKYGDIIFVYGIGCDIAHFSNNYFIFMLK